MEHIVAIDASPSQLCKLRKGLPVRIKKGTGFNLIVRPETYGLVTRAFAKQKGIQVALTPEEIEANQSLSPEQHQSLQEAQPEMAGQGIFGKKFDRGARKVLGKRLQKKVYSDLKHALPGIQAGLDTAIMAGATALSASQPELAPFLIPAGAVASSYLNDYLEHPSDYQKIGKSGIKTKGVKSMAQQMAKAKLNEKLNEQLGTNYDYMSRAGIENALAQQAREQLTSAGIDARYLQPTMALDPYSALGYGLVRSARREIGSITGRGTMLGEGSFYPPALVSQPFSANFQMSHFLPVQYQQFNSGSGLYAGKGLYA